MFQKERFRPRRITIKNPALEEVTHICMTAMNTPHLEIRCDVIYDVNGSQILDQQQSITVEPFEAAKVEAVKTPGDTSQGDMERLWRTMLNHDEHTTVAVTDQAKEATELIPYENNIAAMEFVNPTRRKRHMFKRILTGIVNGNSDNRVIMTNPSLYPYEKQIPFDDKAIEFIRNLGYHRRQRHLNHVVDIMTSAQSVIVYKPQNKK